MNFFEHQHQARRKTGILVVYFVLAVVLIVAALNTVVYLVVVNTASPSLALHEWLQEPYWVWISIGVLAAIVIGTLNTFFKLRGGGQAVAEMVGAQRINTATQDIDERRLINVVEEMAIASGTPMPALYVLEEPAINAFVAGYRPTEAVLVVTRGTLNHLNRDELQGVIGHEYSHVLNGDMRINIRLMGMLAGILLIGQVGRVILRSTRRSRGKGAGQAVLIGLALFIIGYIGLFFGSLIKAAISRQRELLADAASVQFTRNPDGIAGALWKIKQHAEGSLLKNNHSDDVSHFCFGEAVKFNLSSLMATHPPLDQRIKAINPGFIGRVRSGQLETGQPSASPSATASQVSLPAAAAGFAGNPEAPMLTTPAQIAGNVGVITSSHFDHALALHSAIPPSVHSALQTPQGARLVIYALLLSAINKTERAAAIKLVNNSNDQSAVETLPELVKGVRELGVSGRLALVNLALPALKVSGVDQRLAFLQQVEAIIKSDRSYTLFEFVLLTLLKSHLSAEADRDVPVKYFNYSDVSADLRLLLSVLIHAGGARDEQAVVLYQRVMSTFPGTGSTGQMENKYDVATLGAALDKLAALSPLLKQSVIEACADCVLHDGKVKPQEAELLQVIAEVLDCPMPPLLPS